VLPQRVLVLLLLQTWCYCCCCTCVADPHQLLPLLLWLSLPLLLLWLLLLPEAVVLSWQGCQQVLQAVCWSQLQVWAVWGQVGSTALAPGLAQGHSQALRAGH
jgi:hypothetical protein